MWDWHSFVVNVLPYCFGREIEKKKMKLMVNLYFLCFEEESLREENFWIILEGDGNSLFLQKKKKKKNGIYKLNKIINNSSQGYFIFP